MTDIRRSAVSDQDENNIVKYQVEERKDDKLRRHAVIGIGGSSEITVTELNVTENGTYPAPAGSAYSPVNVEVPAPAPNLEDITITENGNYQSSEGYDGIGTATVNVPAHLPDQELVASFDFTSATPSKDLARYGVNGNSNYITFDTSKGAIFDNASSRFFNPYYSLNEGNSYKIEIEFGDIALDAAQTGKRNLFTYASDPTKYNENSNSLGWSVSDNQWKYHTGAGDRLINKPVDYWANDKMTIYYGLSVDTDGTLYLPSVNIDNSSSQSLIIMDKDLITELTAPFQQANPNILLGGGNNLYYFEVKNLKIYRLNNLIEKPIN